MPDPCLTVNIVIGNSSISTNIPELAVGKWPNLRPTFDDMQWTSYEWESQNMTISALDPNHVGGMDCGKYNNETCYYIIGVLGYCAGNQSFPVDYTMVATLTKNVATYGNVQMNQAIEANGVRRFQFCVSDETDVSVNVMQWDSSCDCPSAYTYYDMSVSRTNPIAQRSDLSWKVEHGTDSDNVLILSSDDDDTRPGICK